MPHSKQTSAPRKYRPSLSADEIQDCISALTHSMPQSTALLTLQLYQTRLLLRKPHEANTPESVQKNIGLIPESAIHKPNYPSDVQEEYNKHYSSRVSEVMQGLITESELDEYARYQTAMVYPHHAVILNTKPAQTQSKPAPEPEDPLYTVKLDDI